MKFQITLIVLLSYAFGYSQSQNSNAKNNSLDKRLEFFAQTKKFSTDVTYTVFYNHSDFNKPNDKSVGKIIRYNENFYQKEFEQTKILNDKYEFTCNDNAKVLSISPRRNKNLLPENYSTDSLKQKISNAIEIEKGYQLTLKDGPIEKIDLIFSSQGYISDYRTYYRQKMDFGKGPVKVITQISYSNVIKNPKLDSDYFSIDKYLTIDKNGNVNLKEAYKNYYLINNL